MIQGYGVSRVLVKGCGVVVCGGDLLVLLTKAVVAILQFFASILTIGGFRQNFNNKLPEPAYNAKTERNLRNCDSNLTWVNFGNTYVF